MTEDTRNRELSDVAAEMYIDGYAAFARALGMAPDSPDRQAALDEASMFQGAAFDLYTMDQAA